MVSVKALVLTVAFAAEAFAGRTSSKVNCASDYGTSSVRNVKTQTSTKTQTFTEIKKVIKKQDVTVTPKPTTITVGSTVFVTTTLTADIETDIATTTVINTSTETDTITSTETDTETATITTTSTSTSTIPTPTDGWFPFDANPDFVAKRDLEQRKAEAKSELSLQCDSGKGKFNKPIYVTSVHCTKTIFTTTTKTATSTVPGKTLTLGRVTSFTTTTETDTATSTEYPDNVTSTVTVQTDTTITTTTQVDTTTTTTTTATVQSVVPTTYYEACSSDNLINHANGGYIDSLWPNGNTLLFLTGVTPYDCCVTCLNTDLCIGSYQFGTACYGVKASTCSPGQAASAYYTTKTGSGTGAYLSNGRCGYFRNGA